jgi:hypothetical protein
MNIPTSWMGFHPPDMTYIDSPTAPAIAQHLTTFQAHNIPASKMSFHIASPPDLTYIDSPVAPAIAQHLTTFQAHNIPASQIIVQS